MWTRSKTLATLRVATIVALAVMTAGCADPSGGARFVAPPGVQPMSSAKEGIGHGIFLSDSAKTCCFLSAGGSLPIAKGRGARAAILEIYVPNVPGYIGSGVRLTLSSGRGLPRTRVVPTGIHYMKYAFAPTEWNLPVVDLHYRASPTFVPADVREGADTRELSVLLLEVTFEDQTPQMARLLVPSP